MGTNCGRAGGGRRECESVGGLAWEAVGLDGAALGERVTRYSLLAGCCLEPGSLGCLVVSR
jgi:hypothetical protein